MCEIIKKSSANHASGYKVVWKKGNDFFSLMTGQKYNRNWLPLIRSGGDGRKGFKQLDEDRGFFNEKMVGRTFIFDERSAAVQLRDFLRAWAADKVYCDSIFVVKAMVFGGLYQAKYLVDGNDRYGNIGRRISINSVID